MERVNGYFAVQLGLVIGAFLQHARPTTAITAIVVHAANLQRMLEVFTAQTVPLPLSKGRARELVAVLSRLSGEERLKVASPLSSQEYTALAGAVIAFQNVLASELPALNLYLISKKRAYDMSTLIAQAEDVLPKDVIAALSNQARHAIDDIREAGRCIAFDTSTAAGFHVFRAVEAVVLLYFPVFGINPPQKPPERNLGRYISLLETAGLDVKIVEMLKHLKDHYRNPLMHPEEFLTSDEAVNLFGFAQSAITAMIADQRKEREKPSGVSSTA
ncbi:MAG: hypothetical protein HY727_07150 [Candidatus Rokubacteria bacterium]|nr:hypothetical protein [Candidatus Rokubacteria bacterium]